MHTSQLYLAVLGLVMNAYLFVCIYNAGLKHDVVPALMYDGAFAWAHAANKTLQQGIYPSRNDMKPFGRAVAEHLRNLDFDGKFLLT